MAAITVMNEKARIFAGYMKVILFAALLSVQLASCQGQHGKALQEQRLDSAQALVKSAQAAQDSFMSIHAAGMTRYDSLKNAGLAGTREQLTGDSLKLIRIALDKAVIESKMKLIRLQQEKK